MDKEQTLKKYQSFVFEDYRFNRENGQLNLVYSFDGEIFFEEILTFPVEGIDWSKVNLEALKLALDNLHLIAGVSYYKAYCPSKMVLNKTALSFDQTVFWKRIYERGLGEFFYRNQIDFRKLINFPFVENAKTDPIRLKLSERSLVPIGGGKDSLVTAEILDDAHEDFSFFSLRDDQPIRETAEVLGKKRLVIGRRLAPNLLELNKLEALNGHVPITGFISFLLVVCAVLYDYKNLVMSLEKSADVGQIIFYEMDINHQYSKSYEFEQDFSLYVKKYISPEIEFFSLLRPYYEIRIAQLFSKVKNFDRYAGIFTSCNSNFKIVKDQSKQQKWCCQCPKCAFVFSILAPFVPKEKLVKIFGENLFGKAELKGLFRELLGYQDIKPFECVGTFEEMLAALAMSYEKGDYADSPIMRMFEKEMLPDLKSITLIKEEVMKMHESNNIPDRFLEILYNLGK
jgi:UDP-N-acetyl-alpha-D-muramoyl-L-alanyl-L-glutamate epimerase